MSSVTNGPTRDDRDPTNGRFVAGNKAAVGNPHGKRAQQLRGRILDAVENELGAILTAVVKNASGGDIASARWLLDRAAGTARTEPPATGEPIDLGPLADLSNVADAVGQVVRKIAAGELDAEGGKALLDSLAAQREALESLRIDELDGRLRRLEGRS